MEVAAEEVLHGEYDQYLLKCTSYEELIDLSFRFSTILWNSRLNSLSQGHIFFQWIIPNARCYMARYE